MASVTRAASLLRPDVPHHAEGRRAARDSLIVGLGGQLERVLGIFTVLALRWGLDPARLGVYTGLRLYLDNTNRTSLGVGLGAVQEIPILRAEGRAAEAQRVANIAHTTNTFTCLVYALLLVLWAWWRAPAFAHDPLAAEWTWGLVAVAGLALIKRYESFLIAVLRAHQEFALTTQIDVLESCVSAVAVSVGLWLAGFWGLLAGVAVILLAKIGYLHAHHPLRFAWAWDWSAVGRLMREGLPILANTAAFGAVLNIDRVLILTLVPHGERAVGLYTIALIGTSWSLDLSGRIVTVLYTYFQTTLGRTRDPVAVAAQAMRATEAQAPLLAAGGAAAYLLAAPILGTLMPRYVDGLPALRPLLPGMVLISLAWPARQLLITIGKPYRLFLVTLAALIVIAALGSLGALRGGIVGLAWGMSGGYAIAYALTSGVALAIPLGVRAWLSHQARLCCWLAWFTGGVWLAAHAPIELPRWYDLPLRAVILAAWTVPPLWILWKQNGWVGLIPPKAVAIATDS